MLVNQKLESLVKQLEDLLKTWSTLPKLNEEILEQRSVAEELTRRAIAVFDVAMQRVKTAHQELEAPALAILQVLDDLHYSDVSHALRVKYFPIAKKTIVKPMKRGA